MVAASKAGIGCRHPTRWAPRRRNSGRRRSPWPSSSTSNSVCRSGRCRRSFASTSAPRYEDLGKNLVSGASKIRELDIRSNQVLGSVSYFKHGRLSDHNLKIGREVFRDTTAQSDPAGSYGDVVHILRQGAPLEVYLLGKPTQSVNGLWTYGAYATDTWRATRRLSLNLGLRFDRYRNFPPEQVHAADRSNRMMEFFIEALRP